MSTTTTPPARCCASLATTSSATTPAAVRVRKCASPDGAVRTAISQSVPTDVCMERADGQVFVSAATATKAHGATSVRPTQDAKMASAPSHGSVDATRTGAEYSATKVSVRGQSKFLF